ncbi:MAG: metallophosphoesterase family protein, partial [Bdellovibrionales bacterium]|nr:metallophosphoesterase family protein [Bdellovibrionales bacterium]
MISRREFLRLGGTAAALALAPQAAVAAERLEVEEVEVSVPFLPRPFDFFRIGFLSDTHLGAYVPHEWIESAVRQLNEVQADLVVLGGDYIGYRDSLRSRRYGFSQNNCFDHCPVPLLPKRLLTATADLLGRLKASQGVHAVFGNHDEVVYPGIRDRIFAKRGINPLGNTVVSIRRDAATLQLIGTEDYRTGRPRLPSLPSSRGDNEVRILLTHNPDLLSDVLRNTQFQFDLGLAGHT